MIDTIVLGVVALGALASVYFAGRDAARRISTAAEDAQMSARQERAAEREHLYGLLRLVKVQHPRELDANVESLFPTPQPDAKPATHDPYDDDLVDGGNNVPA